MGSHAAYQKTTEQCGTTLARSTSNSVGVYLCQNTESSCLSNGGEEFWRQLRCHYRCQPEQCGSGADADGRVEPL